MKKHLFAIAALVFTVQLANAQTEQGRQTLGLYVGYNSQKSNNGINNPPAGYSAQQSYKQSTFQLGPTYSYFVADGLDLGTALNYNKSIYEDNTTGTPSKQKNQSYGGDIFLRKYFLYDNKIGVRTGGRAGYMRSTSNYTAAPSPYSANSETKGDEFHGGLTLEALYYPTKHIGISAMLANANYAYAKTTNALAGSGTTHSFNVAFISTFTYLSAFYIF